MEEKEKKLNKRWAVAEARPGRDGDDRKEVRERERTWEKTWGRTR